MEISEGHCSMWTGALNKPAASLRQGRDLTWWVGQWRMKHGEVDQGIGGQKEVGDDGGDDVQLRCKNKVTIKSGSSPQPAAWSTVLNHTKAQKWINSRNNRCACCPTNEDEGKSDPKSQDVASEGFIVLSITLGKDAQTRVDIVLA